MADRADPCGGDIHRIDRFVYLGGTAAASPASLEANGITRVIRLYAGPPDHRAEGVQYFVYPAVDSSSFDIRPFAVSAVQQILAARAANEKILVGCHAGISRSATVVLLYLMLSHRVPLDEALSSLRRVRPCVNPNPGFMACLRATEAKLAAARYQRGPRAAPEPGRAAPN